MEKTRVIVKRPVSASLARAFFYIVLLSILSTGIALLTLASSLRDAEAINIAGSLRMQSYRLGYDLQSGSPQLNAHRQLFQQALHSPVLTNLNVWYVGVGVKYSLSSLFKSNKRIKQAAVETRQAKEAHAVQAEQLNNNVQAAYLQYQQTYVELETQRKSVELAQQNYDVMNARYLSQLALVTDMVDASNLKLNAELSEVDARINIVYAYYRMKYVAGEI